MQVTEAIRARRTIRKFEQQPVPEHTLLRLVDAARLAAFGGNLQPLRFMVIDDKRLAEQVYPATKWAAYLPEWEPEEGERPLAYIAVLADTSVKPAEKCEIDAGAAVENLLLAAVEEGLGACWLGAIDRKQLTQLLAVPGGLALLYLVAVGYPAQTSVAEDDAAGVRYWMDGRGTVHVPKRPLADVLVRPGNAD